MVKLKATGKMGYGTRRMLAADDEGTFEVRSRDMARALVALGHAEAVADEPAKRRGRPPKAAAPEPEPEREPEPEPADELEDKTNAELRQMVEERGFELPAGYVRSDKLVALLRGEG